MCKKLTDFIANAVIDTLQIMIQMLKWLDEEGAGWILTPDSWVTRLRTNLLCGRGRLISWRYGDKNSNSLIVT